MTILTHSDNEQETIYTDCFNEEMAEYYSVEDFRDFIKSYTAVDSDGAQHVFDINKRIMGTGVFWEATEVNNGEYGGYQFAVFAEMDGNQHEAVQKLYEKIRNGLSRKQIHEEIVHGYKHYST
jgi:hypothetical protein